METSGYTPRINTGGNFCGHDPSNPAFVFSLPEHSGRGSIPRVLTLLSERMGRYYSRPALTIPSLNLANGSRRQMRSERRDACLLLLGAIVRYLDVASLRVGIPTKDGFMSLTLDYLAIKCGLSQRRAERAIRDLKAANLLTVSQPRQLMADGSWKGLAAVKAVSRHLFAVFGLKVALKCSRDQATKGLKRKAESWNKDGGNRNLTQLARLQLFLGDMPAQRRQQTRRPTKSQEMDDFERRRRYNLLLAQIIQDNPEWDEDQVREAAAKAL